MKNVLLLFLSACLIACTKEKDTIAERYSDDYRTQWVGHIYDSVEGVRENYELLELLIPKDKNKDTLLNQSKFYVNGKLSKSSMYYDLEVSATDKKHFYKAFIQFHSEYSNLQTSGYKRDIEVSFLNYYQDSISSDVKYFRDEDIFEVGFINYHNDRFTGHITEYVDKDTIIDNNKNIIARIGKIAVWIY